MVDNIQVREYRWTDSSESGASAELFADELEFDYQSSEEEIPFAGHGPIVEPPISEVETQCDFWHMSTIGFILDYWKFSVHHLLHLITAAWCLCGLVIVVGYESYFYLILFEILEDLLHICYEGPWVVDGALFVLERCRPILVINRLQLNFISVGTTPRSTSRVSIPKACWGSVAAYGYFWTSGLGKQDAKGNSIYAYRSTCGSLATCYSWVHASNGWWITILDSMPIWTGS